MGGALEPEGLIESGSLQRRNLGFGPESLWEVQVDIVTMDMAQLQGVDDEMAKRYGPREALLAAAGPKIVNFRASL
jgi:hypothetical protein